MKNSPSADAPLGNGGQGMGVGANTLANLYPPSPRLFVSLALAVSLAFAACGPSTAPSSGRQQPAPAVQPPAAPKTLVIVGSEVFDNFWLFGNRDTEQAGFVDAGFVGQNANTLELFPWLAEEIPSIERGTWRIDDGAGTMETTFRLRPGLAWHDGTPFTSADFRFGWEVASDPKVPITERGVPALISGVDTPDDRTVVVKWKSLYKNGGTFQKQDIRHLPRHILGEPFREAAASGDYTRFENHPHFNREWVGMGAYKLASYTDGTDFSLEAFDRYALGRPKIDRIRYRVITDENAVLTEFLSGTVDISIGGTGLQSALTLREQWEGQGKGKLLVTPLSSRYLSPSFNPWLRDVRVRQALLHGLDREAMNQNLFGGISQVQHMPLNPVEPRFPRADPVATKYPYDVQRAEQLLDSAGWRLGADGARVNPQGERFELEYRATSGNREQEAVQLVVIDFWKQIGVQAEIRNLSNPVARDPANRGRWAGVSQTGGNVSVAEYDQRWNTDSIPNEGNRWVGGNVNQWSNPRVDAMLEELTHVRTTRQRTDDQVVDFIRLWTQEVPALPIVYNVDIIPFKTSVTGVLPRTISGGNGLRNWNVHTWDVT